MNIRTPELVVVIGPGNQREHDCHSPVEDMRHFKLHLVDLGTSSITLNATLSGLRCFSAITRGRVELMARMQPVKLPRTVPVVLSPQFRR